MVSIPSIVQYPRDSVGRRLSAEYLYSPVRIAAIIFPRSSLAVYWKLQRQKKMKREVKINVKFRIQFKYPSLGYTLDFCKICKVLSGFNTLKYSFCWSSSATINIGFFTHRPRIKYENDGMVPYTFTAHLHKALYSFSYWCKPSPESFIHSIFSRKLV